MNSIRLPARFQFLAAVLYSLLFMIATPAAELRGRVTDAVTGKSLNGAAVTLTPVPAATALTAAADLFGMYTFTGVPAGSFTLGATHPGYMPFTEARVFLAADLAVGDIPLVPLVPGEARIDLMIQVFDTGTGRPLKDVPVRVQRYNLLDNTLLEETISPMPLTNGSGTVTLRSQPKGWYTFRFNHANDGTQIPFYRAYDVSTKRKLEQHHNIVAQLLPSKQSLKIRIMGPDPADPGAGAKPLRDVTLELVGFSQGQPFPPDFDPFGDDARDFMVQVMQTVQGRTNELGEFTFDGMPPVGLICTAKRPGWRQSQSVIMPTAAGTLPALHEQTMDLDHSTRIEVSLTSPYRTDQYDGMPVKLEGIEGTNTAGIERIAVSFELPPTAEFPDGATRAEFMDIPPGRYRASVDANMLLSPARALEDATLSVKVRFLGEVYFEASLSSITRPLIELKPVPAMIRGRFYKADTRGAASHSQTADSPGRYGGPAYQTAAQAGIEFTESVLADYLLAGFKVVSATADDDGVFALSVLPGTWGVKIPSLDDYFGSNYRSVNHATGEIISLGWPYAINPDIAPFIPLHPFGSLGIPLNSGDEIDIDLYVRRQVYTLNGVVTVDPESQAQDRVIARTETQTLHLPFCHLAEACEILFNGSAGTAPYLQPQTQVSGDSVLPGSGAGFAIEAPAGSHTITLRGKPSFATPHFTFPSGTSASVVLPDFGSPGAGGRHVNDIIPMEEVWEKLTGVPDPFTCNYQNEHLVEMRFFGRDPDGMGGFTRVLRFTRTQAHFVKHPDLGDRLFVIGGNVPWLLMKGAWTLWRKEGVNWYKQTFTMGAGDPVTKVIEFDLIEEAGGASDPPPTPAYDLRVHGENFHDPNYRPSPLTVRFDDAAEITTPSGGTYSMNGYTGSFVPDDILLAGAGQRWVSTSNDNTNPAYRIAATVQDATPEVTVTLPLTRGSLVTGRLKAHRAAGGEEHTLPLTGVPITLRNRFGVFRAIVDTNDASEEDPGYFSALLPSGEVLFVEVELNGYYPLRLRVEANQNRDDPEEENIDFDLGDITLTTLPEPSFPASEREALFDRRGLFLVGVRHGENPAGGVNDPDVITTYSVKADTPARRELTRPKYDLPSGIAGDNETLQLTDSIEAIYIVDPRSFPGNPSANPPSPALPHVVSDPPSPTLAGTPVKPNPLYPREMQEWITGLVGAFPPVGPPAAVRKNTFFIRRTDLASASIPGVPDKLRYSVSGKLDLASLPPGLYQPWIVARTRRGAWVAQQWIANSDGTGSLDPTKNYLNFYGMTLPKWLNGVADTLGTIKAAESGIGSLSLDAILSDGSISLEPEINGDIEPNTDQTLKYEYQIGASFDEGADTPAVGLLTLGAGFTGLSVSGTLNLEIDGSSTNRTAVGLPAITVSAQVAGGVEGMGPKQTAKYKPTVAKAPRATKKDHTQGPFKLKKFIGVELSGSAGVSLPHRTNESLTPLHLQFSRTVSGGVSFPATVDLTPFAVGIPVVGPAIASLGKADVLVVEGEYEPGVGAEMTRSFTSRYAGEFSPSSPANTPAGMGDGIPLAPRRCVLGEEFLPITVNNKTALLAGLKTGLHIGLQAPGGALGIGAKAGIETIGARSSIGIPSLQFCMNRFGDWPLVTGVKGNITGTWEAYVRAFIFKFTKEGEWLDIPIDQPFNTYEVIHFVPYDETESSSSLTTEPPIEWCALEPHMAAKYSGFCSYATATAGGAAGLAVLDPGGPGGAVRVKFSKETVPGVWSAPVTVASTSAVTAVALHPLVSGSWMMVWAEVPAASLTALAPPTTLKFSTSSTGVTWTAPGTLTTTTGTAFDLRLVPLSGGRLGMVYMQSRRGPDSSLFDLGGGTFLGGTWSPVTTLIAEVPMTAWDLAGPGFTGSGPARFAAISNAVGLFSATWDGAALSPPEMLDPWKENAQCRITAAPGGVFVIAAQRDGGGIALYKKSGAPPWMPLTPVFTDRVPQELEIEAVTSGATTHHFLAWTEGATTRNLAMAWLSDAGAVLGGPFAFTSDTPGRYGCLRARPVPSMLAVDLFTMFENGGENELRVFGLSETTGLIVTDRDGDTLADMAELRIVDADATDGIDKIDDVTAAADFDGDTYTNGIELTAGTDPIDANSFPASRVEITASTDTASELGAASGFFTISRTGSNAASITVGLAITGTADAADYTALPASVTLAAGESAVGLAVAPVSDAAAEGSETVIATLQPGAGYSIGAESAATVTIEDTPFDAWRFTHFTAAELANSSIGGINGDAEFDSTDNLLEYAFDSDPKNGAQTDLPVAGTVIHPGTLEKHLALAYLRRKNDLELVYVVQLGSDLTGWTDATAAEVDEISVVDNNDGTETITIRDKTPLSGQPRRFVRVDVRRVP